MNLEMTQDMDLVKSILFIPEIWERAAEDGANQNEYEPSCGNMSGWLIVAEKEKPLGIILAHYDNTATLKIHPYLLKAFRFRGREMMNLLYEWFLSLPEKLSKIIISIPETEKKVKNFANKVGFIDEGFNRESYLKNGNLYGQWCLGITRKEIKEYLE